MKAKLQRLSRALYLAAAVAVGAVAFAPALEQTVFAGAQVTSRSIQISNSTVSATGVSYLVTFTAQTAALSLVIDFCQNTPIIGGTCTTTNGVTFTGAGLTNGNLPAGWAFGSTSGSTFKAAGTTTALSTSTSYNFTITGVNNPTGTSSTVGATGSFYARIYTYSDNTYGSTSTAYASPTSLGSYVDYGGFALATALNVSISATVMETLTFCVSKLAPGPSCGATGQAVTAPTLTLGTGSPIVLDANGVYTDTAYTQISSNANSGVFVNLKVTSSTNCAGLSRDGGATCGVPAVGAFAAITAGTAAFGLNVADGSGGTGSVTHSTNYGTTAGSYAMRAQAYNTTMGDTIESSSAATSNVNSLLTYGATASPTTPAGVYSTTEALIATGTF